MPYLASGIAIRANLKKNKNFLLRKKEEKEKNKTSCLGEILGRS
jgi:hypothetical protein